MAADRWIPIQAVPKTYNPDATKAVFNPMTVPFTCDFAGVSQTIGAGETRVYPEPLAFHIAKHIATHILHTGVREFLMDKFPGLTEQGRDKWKMQENIIFTRAEISDLQKQLVFEYIPGTPLQEKKVEVPEKVKNASVLKKEAGDEKEPEKESGSDEKEEPKEPSAAKRPSKTSKKETSEDESGA